MSQELKTPKDIDTLIASIDQQLLLKLLDSLIEEQEPSTPADKR
jgi:hypothetical protein